jgi:hypothetical protein
MGIVHDTLRSLCPENIVPAVGVEHAPELALALNAGPNKQ